MHVGTGKAPQRDILLRMVLKAIITQVGPIFIAASRLDSAAVANEARAAFTYTTRLNEYLPRHPAGA